MFLKDLLSRTGSRLKAHIYKPVDYQPQINNDGLINEDNESPEPTENQQPAQNNPVVVKTVQPEDKPASLEKLQVGFDELIGQLRAINEHLNHQVTRHEDLMSRIDRLPNLMESFPAVAENQKQLTQQLLEQLKATGAKEQQFIETIEKIPTETSKQTNALADINHQLAAAADTDVQMTDGFNKFNETLDKLNQNTVGQTDSIMQMSKTFATSDRYLKYLLSRQNKRFMWIFITAIGVCVMAILILTAIIIYIKP